MPNPWSETGGYHGPQVGPGRLPTLDEQAVQAFRRQRDHAAAAHAVDRSGWTRRQWVDDARRLLADVDGSVMDLVNGHAQALLAEIVELERRRDAALADLDLVQAYAFQRTHTPECWQWHAGCLAARVRRTLTGQEAPGGV